LLQESLDHLNTNTNSKNKFLSGPDCAPGGGKEMFRIPKVSACSKQILLNQIMEEIMDEMPPRRDRFWWVKPWGYENTAYLFDYIDPVFRDMITTEMTLLYNALLHFPRADPTYKDPFDYNFLLTLDISTLSKRLIKQLKLFFQKL